MSEEKERQHPKTELIPGAPEVYVRIKPYNPKRGHYKQRFHTFFGFNFRESSGWSRVPAKVKHGGKEFDVAGYLRGVLNNDQDEQSEPVFDVCTKAEAQAIAKREKREAEQRNTPDTADVIGGANNPRDMTKTVQRSAEDEEVTSRDRRGRKSEGA